MLISPFTPIFFLDPKVDGVESPYIQTFANSDYILIELIMSDNNPGDDKWRLRLRDIARGEEHYLSGGSWYINDFDYVNFYVLHGLSDGTYCIIVENPDYELTSAPFIVTSDATILQNTTLLQYSMKSNRLRKDAIFFIDNMHYFFEFRIPGGFKDNGWTFGVDSEQFITENADPIQLYAREHIMRKLTVGTSEGCPIWFGGLLNRIFCCSYVYVDGVRYSRTDTSVPEITNTLDGVNSFIFSQNIQQVVNDDFMLKNANSYHIEGGVYDPALNRRFTNSQMLILRTLGAGNMRSISNVDQIRRRNFRNV